jgi:hypothetical protein
MSSLYYSNNLLLEEEDAACRLRHCRILDRLLFLKKSIFIINKVKMQQKNRVLKSSRCVMWECRKYDISVNGIVRHGGVSY